MLINIYIIDILEYYDYLVYLVLS